MTEAENMVDRMFASMSAGLEQLEARIVQDLHSLGTSWVRVRHDGSERIEPAEIFISAEEHQALIDAALSSDKPGEPVSKAPELDDRSRQMRAALDALPIRHPDKG
jgi:hypothetical protein